MTIPTSPTSSLTRTHMLQLPLSGTAFQAEAVSFPEIWRSFHRDKTGLSAGWDGEIIGRIKQEKTGMGGAWTADDPRGYSKTHPPGI